MGDQRADEAKDWIHRLVWLEKWGYLTAGLSFLVLGMVIFLYGWYAFFVTLHSGILHAALTLTNDLLFVIILLELFRTVINFLKSHVITLEPFLYVGIIAGIRRILTGGALLTNLETMSADAFNRYLWDIGLNLVIVIALVVAVFVYHWVYPARERVG
jgi:uncharacterized membrane protein (DUF373 family)